MSGEVKADASCKAPEEWMKPCPDCQKPNTPCMYQDGHKYVVYRIKEDDEPGSCLLLQPFSAPKPPRAMQLQFVAEAPSVDELHQALK